MMKYIKGLIISAIVLSSFIFAIPVFAEEQICLPTETGSRIVVDLEKGQICQEKVTLLEQANQELEKQVGLLEQVNKLQKEQLQVLKDTNEQYRILLKDQGTMYKDAIEASKPSFFKDLKNTLGAMGLGALFMAIVLL